MSHAYPIAKTARAALASADKAARTRHEAEVASDGAAIAVLETEWLTPKAKDLPGLLEKADQGPGNGFLQHYEDAAGKTVLAVTYWKLARPKTKPPKPAPKPKPIHDDTDDLYFKRRPKNPRKRKVDPNQLDMFGIDPPDEAS